MFKRYYFHREGGGHTAQRIYTNEILNAYDVFGGEDVGVVTETWDHYIAREDVPCIASDGLHQLTAGSCARCELKDQACCQPDRRRMFNFFKKRPADSTPPAPEPVASPVDPPQQQAVNASFYQFADGSTVEILLPRLCGSRQAAAMLVERATEHLKDGKLVQLNARLTTVGTEAYSDELVNLLGKANVKRMLVTPTTLEFERNLLAAGKKHGLSVELIG